MDTSTGNKFKTFEAAIKAGVSEENVIELNVIDIESNKALMGVLRFLIKDNAFHEEFLLTTIIEYICNNGGE